VLQKDGEDGRTHRLRNEEVLRSQEGDEYPTKRIKANWIGHILRRNCLLKHVIEGKIEGRTEVTGRRGRRHKQLLCDPKKGKKKGILEIETGSTRSHSMEMFL